MVLGPRSSQIERNSLLKDESVWEWGEIVGAFMILGSFFGFQREIYLQLYNTEL